MVLVDDVVIALEGSFSFIKKLKVDIILRQQPDCKKKPIFATVDPGVAALLLPSLYPVQPFLCVLTRAALFTAPKPCPSADFGQHFQLQY